MKNLKKTLTDATIIEIKDIAAIKSGSELIISFENENELESFLNEDPTELFNELKIKSLRPCTKKEFTACLDAMEPSMVFDFVSKSKYFLSLIKNEGSKRINNEAEYLQPAFKMV